MQRLEVLSPALGKMKIAQVLARAGLHLATTTVGRVLKEHPQRLPLPNGEVPAGKRRVVTATSAHEEDSTFPNCQ